jgi:hypothetical protein
MAPKTGPKNQSKHGGQKGTSTVRFYEAPHFEAQTLLSAELQDKVHKTEDQVNQRWRENRVKDQKNGLEGLRFQGEEECSYQSYDMVLNMLERVP